MENKKRDRNKVIAGAIIGGLVTGAAYYLWKGKENGKRPFLEKMGRALSDVGERIEESSVKEKKEAFDRIESSLRKNHGVNHMLTWVATGLNLWEQFRKRD